MLPNEGLPSTQVLPSEFVVPMRQSNYLSYSYGAADIGNTAGTLMYQKWRSGYNGTHILLYKENSEVGIPVIPVENVQHIAFTFDQNMNPFILYMVDGVTYQYWYDSVAAAQVTTELGTDFPYAQCSLDDPRPEFTGESDIIVAYIKSNGDLCYRVQRERYLTEYVFATQLTGRRLTQIGISKNYRFRFRHVVE